MAAIDWKEYTKNKKENKSLSNFFETPQEE